MEPDALCLGAVPYAQTTNAEVMLVNTGAVPFDFTAAVEPVSAAPEDTACGACTVSPVCGHVRAFSREPLRVQVSHTLLCVNLRQR